MRSGGDHLSREEDPLIFVKHRRTRKNVGYENEHTKMRKFHLIARAVILNDDHVLLARQKGMSNTFLPGGHINIGESAVAALKREIYQELGLELEVEGYLGALEADWDDDGTEQFEINHIFKAGIKRTSSRTPLESQEDHLEFLWSSIEDLYANNLLPHPLKKLIANYATGDRSIWWESTLVDRE